MEGCKVREGEGAGTGMAGGGGGQGRRKAGEGGRGRDRQIIKIIRTGQLLRPVEVVAASCRSCQ